MEKSKTKRDSKSINQNNFNYIAGILILSSLIILAILVGIAALDFIIFFQILQLLSSMVGISMIILIIVIAGGKRIILKIMHTEQPLFNLISVAVHWVYSIISAIIIIVFASASTASILNLFFIMFIFIALCLVIDIVVNIILHFVDDFIFD